MNLSFNREPPATSSSDANQPHRNYDIKHQAWANTSGLLEFHMSVYGVLDDVNVSVVGTTKVIDSHDVLPSNSKNVLSLEIQNAVFINLNHFF